jgi:hypothetical protein
MGAGSSRLMNRALTKEEMEQQRALDAAGRDKGTPK